MTFQFELCEDCKTRYQALRTDPSAKYSLCIMPLCSLIWNDEHPDGRLPSTFEGDHHFCRASMIRLCSARTYLWRNNVIPEESLNLWKTAQHIMPEWPGFNRLILDDEEKRSLDACNEELDDLMGAIHNDFPFVTTHDEGGGLTWFTAARNVIAQHSSMFAPQPPDAKKWWQFWQRKTGGDSGPSLQR